MMIQKRKFEDLPECDLRDLVGFYWSIAKLKLGSNATEEDLYSCYSYTMADFIGGINDYRAVIDQMELMVSQYIDIMGVDKYNEIIALHPYLLGEPDTARKVYCLSAYYSQPKND